MTDSGLGATLTASAYAFGWSAVRRMPERVAYGAFERLADQTYARGGVRVATLRSNLRRVVGPDVTDADLDRLVRQGLRSYMRYWCEVFRLPTWTPEKVRERVVIHDVEILDKALAEGAGVVLALPHAANWDAAAAWVSATGRLAGGAVPFTTVAERVRPESLYDRFVAYRESLGLEVLPLTGAGSVVRTLAQRLRAGGLVVLPADRDVSGNGVDVEFFGDTARMPGGPAMLAHLTGAPLITVDLWYDGEGRTHVRIHAPVELSTSDDKRARVAETTQLVARSFEHGIRENPQDWHVLQPLWVEDIERAEADHAEHQGPAA